MRWARWMMRVRWVMRVTRVRWVKRRIIKLHDTHIDKKSARFVLLLFIGGFGLVLGVCLDVQFFCGLGLDKKVAEYVATAVVGIPVFIFLWYFRTRDVRQQIEKTQELINESQRQMWQNHFHNAIENLTAENIIKEKIGVRSLIELYKESQESKEFHKAIINAFEIKIKKTEQGIPNEELIEEIKKWLSKHKKSEKE